jgi:hypothetical protein
MGTLAYLDNIEMQTNLRSEAPVYDEERYFLSEHFLKLHEYGR